MKTLNIEQFTPNSQINILCYKVEWKNQRKAQTIRHKIRNKNEKRDENKRQMNRKKTPKILLSLDVLCV